VKIHIGTQITFLDNDDNEISGVVVEHDDHLRCIVQKKGSGVYDALAIVGDERIRTIGLEYPVK